MFLAVTFFTLAPIRKSHSDGRYALVIIFLASNLQCSLACEVLNSGFEILNPPCEILNRAFHELADYLTTGNRCTSRNVTC